MILSTPQPNLLIKSQQTSRRRFHNPHRSLIQKLRSQAIWRCGCPRAQKSKKSSAICKKQAQTYNTRVASDCFTRMFPTVTIWRQRVANLNRLSNRAECLLTNGSKVTLSPLIAAHIAPVDDVSFPMPNSSTTTAEILVTKIRWPALGGTSTRHPHRVRYSAEKR